MIHGAAVDLFLLLVYALIGTLIGAVILKASCALFNLFAGALGEASSPPMPQEAVAKHETGIQVEPAPILMPDDDARNANLESKPGVPKPSFEWAMGIAFVSALVSAVLYFLLFRILRLVGQAPGLDALKSMPFYLVFSPLSFLLHGATIAAMLPTRFGKGLLIAALYLFFSLLIAAAVVGSIALVFGLKTIKFE